MKISEKFAEITSYQGNNFKEWFGDMEYEDVETTLYSKILERDMTDTEILKELKPTELTLGEVFNHLREMKHSIWAIFYCRDKNKVLRAVFVHWGVDGWYVYADEVTIPRGWRDGCQVFSRNPFDTLTISTPNLESRVQKLEDFMLKVSNMLIIK